MKTLLKSLTLLFVISFILSACNPVEPVEAIQSDLTRETNPVVTEADFTAIANGNNAFALDLLHQLGSGPGNFFIPLTASPPR